MEFLLEYAVANFIHNGYDEPIFLFEETFVHLLEVTVPVALHVHFR